MNRLRVKLPTRKQMTPYLDVIVLVLVILILFGRVEWFGHYTEFVLVILIGWLAQAVIDYFRKLRTRNNSAESEKG